MIIHELDVDMTPGGHAPTLRVNQWDSDFGIVINLYNSKGTFSLENGTTAKLCGTKPDGAEFETNATISAGKVVVAGTDELTSASGKGVLEVCLIHSGKKLFSQNFLLRVEKEANREGDNI